MRYSKVFFVLLLTLVLIFGGTQSSFATVNKHMLTLETDGGGSVSGGGWYYFWDNPTVTATADDGYEFDKWTKKVSGPDPIVSEDAVFVYDMPNDHVTLEAHFQKKSYNLSIAVNDSLMGGYSATKEGSVQYKDWVEVDALPIEGYRVKSWTVNEAVTETHDTNYDFKMPANDVAILITFEPIPSFEVTGSVDPEGKGSIDGLGPYQVGDAVTLTAMPIRGYACDGWDYEDGLPDAVSGCTTLTFTMPEEDVDVTAYFYELTAHEVVLQADPEEGGDPFFEGPDYGGMYYPGEVFTVDPNPSDHFTFTHWTWDWKCVMPDPPGEGEILRGPVVLECINESDKEDYEFWMDDCALYITAHYEEDPFIEIFVECEDKNGVSLRPTDPETVKLYYGEYTVPTPSISGYENIFKTSNYTGVIDEETEPFTVTFVYQRPPTPQVITDTVVVTETVVVTVPATTAATTEEVTEEETPLAPAGTPIDLDSIYKDMPVVEEEVVEELPVEEVPLADALPQTGQLPVEGFYGIGGLISAVGIFIRKRFNK